MSWIKTVSEYVFGKTPIERYSKNREVIEMANYVLKTHGMNGKMMEKLIQYRFGIIDDGEIHGYDGIWNGRNVEIKTQRTGNKRSSSKLNCKGDFSDHRAYSELKSEKYLRDRPILISAGIDSENAKCIYVVKTDFEKIPTNSKMFEMLSARAPRINFNHFKNFVDSYEVMYKNDELLEKAIHNHKINFDLGVYLSEGYSEDEKNILREIYSPESFCLKPSSSESFF